MKKTNGCVKYFVIDQNQWKLRSAMELGVLTREDNDNE